MKVIIIEDEKITAEDLCQTILEADQAIEIVAILNSVTEGIAYFKHNDLPDLIFSDIRLGDGHSFEILDGLNIPVIFCTAYDEYALKAFKAYGIDYIVKPFTLNSVVAALQKFKKLSGIEHVEVVRQYEAIKNLFDDIVHRGRETALLIRFQDKITPVKTETIAFIKLESLIVQLFTFDGRIYYPNQSLEELERILDQRFFRVNRQFLVNRKAIVNVSSLLSRKLSISLSVIVNEPILVSKEKTPLFLKWLSGM